MNDLVIIVILGGNPDKDTWLGMKPFLLKTQEKYPGRIKLVLAVWGEYDTLRTAAQSVEDGKQIIIIAHSYGAHRATELANGKYGRVKRINNMILCDPKPTMVMNMEEWWEFGDYSYETPTNVDTTVCYHGWFGASISESVNEEVFCVEVPLELKHDEFFADKGVQLYVLTQIEKAMSLT